MSQYSAICCYFGQWPNHFCFWLRSCSYNENIDFFLVSDIPIEGYVIPKNVHIVKKSFSQVQELVRSKFSEIKVSLDRPYKLCDFKTAYGYIFEDLFYGYKYWGFYDIDTIWGNIIKFIPENNENHLVKIFPCGHLCFIRNIAPYDRIYELVNDVSGKPCRDNMLGKNVASWQVCFSSPDNYYYDESGGLEPWVESLLPQGKLSNEFLFHEISFDNIFPSWFYGHFKSINFPQKSHFLTYSFEEGHLYRHYLSGFMHKQEEISYIHASQRTFTVFINQCQPTHFFCIYPDAIVPWRTWKTLPLLIYGRPRYLKHFVLRINRKILGFLQK